MKKKLNRVISFCSLISIVLCACGKQGNPVVLPKKDDVTSISVTDGEKYAMSSDGEEEDSADNTPTTVIFRATVMEVTDSSILVKPIEDSLELNSADEFSLPNKEQLELQIGDLVEITYNGDILESYPAQLGEVYKITLVE